MAVLAFCHAGLEGIYRIQLKLLDYTIAMHVIIWRTELHQSPTYYFTVSAVNLGKGVWRITVYICHWIRYDSCWSEVFDTNKNCASDDVCLEAKTVAGFFDAFKIRVVVFACYRGAPTGMHFR